MSWYKSSKRGNTYDLYASRITSIIFPFLKKILTNPYVIKMDEGAEYYSDLSQNVTDYLSIQLVEGLADANGMYLNKNMVPFRNLKVNLHTINGDINVGGFAGPDPKTGEFLLILDIGVGDVVQEAQLETLYSGISRTIRHELEHYNQIHQKISKGEPISLPSTSIGYELWPLENPESFKKYMLNEDEIKAYIREALFASRKDKQKSVGEHLADILALVCQVKQIEEKITAGEIEDGQAQGFYNAYNEIMSVYNKELQEVLLALN
jgi:hypothetical protein